MTTSRKPKSSRMPGIWGSVRIPAAADSQGSNAVSNGGRVGTGVGVVTAATVGHDD